MPSTGRGSATTVKAEFEGHSGAQLAARIDIPAGHVRAYALFAHCFTCSKDLAAVRRISADLARAGIAVMRFDFTGLGSSEGEFASTNFSSNIADLRSAVAFLRDRHQAPEILIGHSLGGAAVLSLAGDCPEVRAVATIGAPADVDHVIERFGCKIDEIEEHGEATVTLAGRAFKIRKHFLEDVRTAKLKERIAKMHKPLLVLHSPIDDSVGIDNAAEIFMAAKHPKSFVSLDTADHLLTNVDDAAFAAGLISTWASRYLDAERPVTDETIEHVRVTETGAGKFQTAVKAGRHRLFADEPESYGGLDTGPSPYDFLSIALGACTSMTLRLYANKKKLGLGRVSVNVSHEKVHFEDCADCTEDMRTSKGMVDRFERVISVEGEVAPEIADKLLEIADKCPVHRTLEARSKVSTRIA